MTIFVSCWYILYMARKKTRKKSSRSSSSLTSSQKNLKIRQNTPWKRILDKGYDTPYIYSIPWEERALSSIFSAENFPGIGYVSNEKYPLSDDYIAKEYSWEDSISSHVTNKYPQHSIGDHEERYILRQDQKEDVDVIVNAYNNNVPEFLIAHQTGLGKTVTAWSAIKEIQPKSVLIVCPVAVIPVWRQHIKDIGTGDLKDITIINYESLRKLISPPDEAVKAKKTATQNKNIALHGKPYRTYDVIIFDEAHKLKNPISQQSRIAHSLCKNASFVLKLSATPGKDPSQLHHLWRGLSFSTGDNISVIDDDFSQYVDWCRRHGITGIETAPFGNGIVWNGKYEDLKNMESIIYKSQPTWALRRMSEGDNVMRQPVDVQLSSEDRKAYNVIVEDAKKEILEGHSRGRIDVSKGLSAMMSLRQKAGILKCPFIVDYTQYCLNDLDEQVVIATIFKKTTETISELLTRSGIDHVIVTGDTSNKDKEEYRLRFQRGDVKVIVTSITTGISLHAEEDSSQATSHDRRMIVADMHWSPMDMYQLEGRINRNGKTGVITFPVIQDTIDEKITRTVINGMISHSIIQDNGEINDLILFAQEIGINIDSSLIN